MRTWSRVERPSPPTSSGISAFISPISQACSQISLGNVPCSSSFCATGMIFSRVNLRAVSTSLCCSSVSEKSMDALPSGKSGRSLFHEGAHALAAVLCIEQKGERLCFLAVGRAQRHVVAALDQPLGAGDCQRPPLGGLQRDRAAVIEQLLLRQHRVDEPPLLRPLRLHPVAGGAHLLRPE